MDILAAMIVCAVTLGWQTVCTVQPDFVKELVSCSIVLAKWMWDFACRGPPVHAALLVAPLVVAIEVDECIHAHRSNRGSNSFVIRAQDLVEELVARRRLPAGGACSR